MTAYACHGSWSAREDCAEGASFQLRPNTKDNLFPLENGRHNTHGSPA